MACKASPFGAFVASGPDFAAGGAEVEPHGLMGVGAHGLALDGEPGLFPG